MATDPAAQKPKRPTWIRNFGIITSALSLLGGVVAFSYNGIRDHNLRKDELDWRKGLEERDKGRLALETQSNDRDSKKAFLELQMKTYDSTIQVVSRLLKESANNSDTIEEFRSLYRGEMPLVEDRRVEFAMILLGRTVGLGEKIVCNRGPMEIMLAHCMRISIANSWNFNVERDDVAPDGARRDAYCNADNALAVAAECRVNIDPNTLSLFQKIDPINVAAPKTEKK